MPIAYLILHVLVKRLLVDLQEGANESHCACRPISIHLL